MHATAPATVTQEYRPVFGPSSGFSKLNAAWRPPVLAAVWLSAVVLLWVDWPALHTLAAVTLGLIAALSLTDARKETLVVVAVIVALIGLLLWSGAAADEVVRGLDRSLIFAALLPTLAMTRSVARGLSGVLMAQDRIAKLPRAWAGVGLLFGGHAFGYVLNTGSFALMSSIIPDDSPEDDRRAAALATLRGMNTTAFYSPFFVGFAVAYTYFPAVPVWQVFVLGGGLAVVGLLVGLLLYARPLSWAGLQAGLGCLAPVIPPMGGAVVLVVIASHLLPISTLGGVLMVMPVLAALHVLSRPHRLRPVLADTRRAMAGMGDDLAVISAAMVLGTLAESAPPIREVVSPWIAGHMPPWAAVGATVGVMVGFAIAGLHPMITGTVMMASLAGSGLAIADLPLMIAMMFGWGMGAMNSISSLSVITAAQMFRVSPMGLAFGPNLIYAAVLGTIVVLVLTGVNAVIVGG